MKKQILNIGKALSRAEQKLVFAGDVLMNVDDDGASGCMVKCKDGNIKFAANCREAPDNLCFSSGWSICIC